MSVKSCLLHYNFFEIIKNEIWNTNFNMSLAKRAEGPTSNRAVRQGCYYDGIFLVSAVGATSKDYRCRSYRPHSLNNVYISRAYALRYQVSDFQPSQFPYLCVQNAKPPSRKGYILATSCFLTDNNSSQAQALRGVPIFPIIFFQELEIQRFF